VIEPGVDHLPEPDIEAARALVEPLGVRGQFILSVGTREPRKNLDMLIAAYSDVRDSLPDRWPLVVVGPAGWGSDLRPRDGVVLAGQVSGEVLAGLYATAELLVYVPLLEGFGLPPVEAMLAGIPVVSSAVPSVGPAVGGAALLVDPRNRQEIADGLLTVSTDAAVRRKLVIQGKTRVEKLTWKQCASHHVELWRAVTRSKK
jgi:glycosyltransferase involved in cell wall biosynthesis